MFLHRNATNTPQDRWRNLRRQSVDCYNTHWRSWTLDIHPTPVLWVFTAVVLHATMSFLVNALKAIFPSLPLQTQHNLSALFLIYNDSPRRLKLHVLLTVQCQHSLLAGTQKRASPNTTRGSECSVGQTPGVPWICCRQCQLDPLSSGENAPRRTQYLNCPDIATATEIIHCTCSLNVRCNSENPCTCKPHFSETWEQF